MIRGLYTSASGMIVQMEREDTIANNIANVNTAGYKKDQTVIKQFPEFEVYRKDDEKIVTPFEHKSKLKHREIRYGSSSRRYIYRIYTRCKCKDW